MNAREPAHCGLHHIRQCTKHKVLDTTFPRSVNHVATGFDLMLHLFLFLEYLERVGLCWTPGNASFATCGDENSDVSYLYIWAISATSTY